MPEKPQVIDVIFSLKKEHCDQAFALANILLNTVVKKAGVETHPYIVNMRTVEMWDTNFIEDVFRGVRDKQLKTYLEPEKQPQNQLALDVMFGHGDRLHVNSADPDIVDWKNFAIVFADENGAIPDFIKKWHYKWVGEKEADGEALNMVSDQYGFGGGPNDKKAQYRKGHKYIAYPNHIIVLPRANRYPHPNTLAQAKRIWTTHLDYLKKLVDTCDECGGQMQFMMCPDCGGQLQRVRLCPKCKAPMVHKDSKYICSAKACKTVHNETEARKLDTAFACRNVHCNVLLDMPKFVEHQQNMTCVKCQYTRKHPRVAFVGETFEHLDFINEYRTVIQGA